MHLNLNVPNPLKVHHRTVLLSFLCCILAMQLMIAIVPNTEASASAWPYDVGISYLRDNNRIYSYSFTVTNISDEPQPAPKCLILPLESFNVINPDGYTASGNPYCGLNSVKGNMLGAGMSLPPETLKFPNLLPPNTKPPYVTTKDPDGPDNGGDTDNKLPAGETPNILATANPTMAHIGEYVSFDYLYYAYKPKHMAMIAGIEWDFGDGSSVLNMKNPTHRYTETGMYIVSVKVLYLSDPGPAVVKTDYIVITVYNNPPMASAFANPSSGSTPLEVNFDGSASYDPDDDPIIYSWDFKDGSATTSAVNPIHTYTKPGTYDVTLTVTDCYGLQDTAEMQIDVKAYIEFAAVDIETYVNGQDADEHPGPFIAVGDQILWEYIVTNTGNITLTNIMVRDIDDIMEYQIGTIQSLAPGASQTFTRTDTAKEGVHANISIAQVSTSLEINDIDISHYYNIAY